MIVTWWFFPPSFPAVLIDDTWVGLIFVVIEQRALHVLRPAHQRELGYLQEQDACELSRQDKHGRDAIGHKEPELRGLNAYFRVIHD